MIKVRCDLCGKKIKPKKEVSRSFSIEINIDGATVEHTFVEETFPTSYNKTFCDDCYYAIFKYFMNEIEEKGCEDD